VGFAMTFTLHLCGLLINPRWWRAMRHPDVRASFMTFLAAAVKVAQARAFEHYSQLRLMAIRWWLMEKNWWRR
jgi:hypothetical protein